MTTSDSVGGAGALGATIICLLTWLAIVLIARLPRVFVMSIVLPIVILTALSSVVPRPPGPVRTSLAAVLPFSAGLCALIGLLTSDRFA